MAFVSPTKPASADNALGPTPPGFQGIRDNFLAQLKSVLPDQTFAPSNNKQGIPPGMQKPQGKAVRLFESQTALAQQRDLDEMTKIKYSIEGMLKKRDQLTTQESVEARFAHRLNQIATTASSTPEYESRP